MGDVAILGLGMHPWGKFPEKSLNQICRVAVESALADAHIGWSEVGALRLSVIWPRMISAPLFSTRT